MISRRLLTTASAFALVLLSVYVIVLAVADILDDRAETVIRNWVESSKSPSKAVWNESIESLRRAHLLDPMNSEILEKQGLLYQYGSLASHKMSENYVQANQMALVYFKQAAERRPAWAPYWAHIIHTKNSIWVVDKELDRAIINAAQSGPWFEIIQPAVLHAGARSWPALSEDARKAVIKVMHSAIQVQPRQTISIVLSSGLIEYAVPLIEQDPELKKFYRQIIASRKRKANQQMEKLAR